MCYSCYEENEKPAIVNERTIKAAGLIEKIYAHENCGAGGYAHIVVDDWNLDDSDIDYCLESANKRSYDISEEATADIIECLKYLRELSMEERYSAMAIHEGFLTITQGTEPGNEIYKA